MIPDRPLDPPDNNDEEIRERAEEGLEEYLVNVLEEETARKVIAKAIKKEDWECVKAFFGGMREGAINALVDIERSEPHCTISDDDGRGR
jgi:hypothetical protein